MSGLGNEVQMRTVADQVAMAAIERWHQQHPPAPPEAKTPAPLKWAGAIVAALLSAMVIGCCFWVVTSLSALQQTVTRIDERQQIGVDDRRETKMRLEKIEERLGRIETKGTDGS